MPIKEVSNSAFTWNPSSYRASVKNAAIIYQHFYPGSFIGSVYSTLVFANSSSRMGV